MQVFNCDVLVIGGGGAGMSAALAASSAGRSVTIVDENPSFGGQIWRKDADLEYGPEAGVLIEQLDRSDITFLSSTVIFDRARDESVYAVRDDRRIKLSYKKLIIATGARERFLPFPGWTLPNVFGAGGLQALVKNGFPIDGKKVVISGSGPLLLAVADCLRKKGARILFVAEQASRPTLAKFAMSLVMSPSKLLEAASYRLSPGAPKLYTSTFITAARGENELESVTILRKGNEHTFQCDLLAVGFHLVPNLELAQLLELETDQNGVVVDKNQETSRKNTFAAGESTGIGGIELACIEGKIAGFAAAGSLDSDILRKKRSRQQKFAKRLNKTFELREELKTIPDEDTIVCRCEDVDHGNLQQFSKWRDAKLQTRCGMGPCQGRVCGPAASFLYGWDAPTVNPPIFPVKLKHLGDKL